MVGIHALSIAKFGSKTKTNRNGALPIPPDRGALHAAVHSPNGSVHAHKDLLQVSPLAMCLSALDARTGGRYPVGAHDRPLRWRFSISDESLRQGFFQQLSAWPPCRWNPGRSACLDDPDDEAVPALEADGLQCRGIDAPRLPQQIERGAGADHV